MKYYRLINDSNHYHSLKPIVSLPVDWVNQFDGKIFGDNWQPLEMCFDEAEGDGKTGDFSHFAAHIPALSIRAWNLLKPLIGNYVESLELQVNGNKKFYFLNVIHILDSLHINKSDIQYFYDSHIMTIKHYEFDEKKIGGAPIFRIRNYEVGGVYVNDVFRVQVESNQLEGLIWEQLP